MNTILTDSSIHTSIGVISFEDLLCYYIVLRTVPTEIVDRYIITVGIFDVCVYVE